MASCLLQPLRFLKQVHQTENQPDLQQDNHVNMPLSYSFNSPLYRHESSFSSFLDIYTLACVSKTLEKLQRNVKYSRVLVLRQRTKTYLSYVLSKLNFFCFHYCPANASHCARQTVANRSHKSNDTKDSTVKTATSTNDLRPQRFCSPEKSAVMSAVTNI